jgi:hypothetical protein
MGNKAEAAAQHWKISLADADRDAGLSCRVPRALRTRARKLALEHQTTLQEVVITALDDCLKKRGA